MTAARKALEALAKADADVKDAADSKAWRIASDTQHHLRVNLSAPLAAVVRAAMDRPWWLDNFVDKHERDYRVCLGCRKEWYADHGGKRVHGALCSFAAADAALDAFAVAAQEMFP